MKKLFCLMFLLGTLLASTAESNAQSTTVTLQAGTPRNNIWYRSAEVMHTTKDKLVIDFMYYGFSGDDEFWLGIGTIFEKEGSEGKASATPIVWLVKGRQNDQLGLGYGGYYAASYKRFNLNSSLYGFLRAKGNVSSYFYLDGLDGTFVFGPNKRFEAGASVATFSVKGLGTDSLSGGVFKVNDKHGTTAFYFRGDPNGKEARITRTFVF